MGLTTDIELCHDWRPVTPSFASNVCKFSDLPKANIDDETLSRPMFVRNARDTFVVSTPMDIGFVQEVTIRHDNYSGNAKWFLGRLEVLNMNRPDAKPHLFWCNQWLALDVGSGLLSQTLVAETASELVNDPVRNFEAHLSDALSEYHTVASAFLCPPSSNFNHAQRVMVIQVYFMVSMFGNASLQTSMERFPRIWSTHGSVGSTDLEHSQIWYFGDTKEVQEARFGEHF